MKSILIGAATDLGVHVDGSRLAPKRLITDLTSFYKGESILLEQDPNIIKSRGLADKRKNITEIETFNKKLYEETSKYLENGYFPIIVGGDHSITIASSLACSKKYENIGLICLDSHSEYSTLDSSGTGDIAGMTLAAANGYRCGDLRAYHSGKIISSQNTVIIGVDHIDTWQKENIKYSGVTVFTKEDIKNQGIDAIMTQALKKAGEKTNGIYVSIDLALFAPNVATGVSIPAIEGITEEEGMEFLNTILKQINKVIAFDLVEYNPIRDQNRKTEQIAVNILAKMIMAVEKK